LNKTLIDNLLTHHKDIRLVMASKYLEASQIYQYVDAGISDFGESRVDAFLQKEETLRDTPITWHFIGTLQSKKVKHIINKIDVLHSLDRLSLAKAIQKHREDPLPCLIQVNISKEENKHGVKPASVLTFIKALEAYPIIKVIGLMGIALHSDDEAVIHRQFETLKRLRDRANKTTKDCKELSMGMSEDYSIAIKEGATMLRLGRILISEGSL
jgi:pyridoxal phosphate enzyme (YggS family)